MAVPRPKCAAAVVTDVLVVRLADHSQPYERLPQPVAVQAELAVEEGGAGRGLLGLAGLRLLDRLPGASPGDDHDPVVVGEDHVAGADDLAVDRDRHVHRAAGGLDGALRRDGTRPGGEAHVAQLLGVADAGVHDDPAHPALLEGGREQLAEQAVRARGGGGDDEDVALAALLHRGVDHEVVAGPAQHGDGGTGDPHALLDGADPRAQQPGPSHGLAHGRDAEPGQRVDVLQLRLRGSVTMTPLMPAPARSAGRGACTPRPASGGPGPGWDRRCA